MNKKKGANRHVTRRPSGEWANTKAGADRATSIHRTQREAENAARENLRNQGGGELITHGRDGRIRSKDTISRPDPFPPRDREH